MPKSLGNIYSEDRRYFSNSLKFRDEVYTIFENNLSGEETIEPNFRLTTEDGRTLSIGLFMPKGCSRLGVDKPICMETRLVLRFNSIDDIFRRFEYIKKSHPDYYFLLIYNDLFTGPIHFEGSPGIDVRVLSYTDLFNVFDTVKPKNEKTENKPEAPSKRKKSLEEATKQTLAEKSRNRHDDLWQALIDNKCTLILGAGVSMDAGVPSWKNLLIGLIQKSQGATEKKAKEILENLLENNNHSYLIVARILLSKMDRNLRNQWIRDLIYNPNNSKGKLTGMLAQLIRARQISEVITYNYDTLLEDKIKEQKINCISVSAQERITRGNVTVYHVHGIVVDSNSSSTQNKNWADPVITEEDYHKLYGNNNNWSNIITLNALNHSVCVLLGLSMTDPNLRRLLEISMKESGEDKPIHYIFMPKYTDVSEDDCQIQEDVLTQLGLNVIWYDVNINEDKDGNKTEDHSELLEMIKDLK